MQPYKTYLSFALSALVAGFLFFLVFNNAWMTEDAYINFRSLEQFLQGNGLRWNMHERVQVFTSPLWFLLQAPLVFVSNNFFMNAIALSALLQLAFWYLVWRLSGRNLLLLTMAMALSMGSSTFIDYSSSGLENPLLHVLLAALFGFYQACYDDNSDDRFLAAFLLSCALLILARHDMATLAFLPFAHICFRKRKKFALLLKLCFLCGAPFVLWSLFALLYYGSIFPNTAYAKLNTGMEAAGLYRQGLDYLYICYRRDPLTAFVIAAAFASGLFSARRRVFSIALALNAFYIVAVAGDFMLGRFLSPAYALSLVMLMNFVFSLKGLNEGRQLIAVTAVALLSFIHVWRFDYSVFNQPWNHGQEFLYHGVSDERLKWSKFLSLRAFLKREQMTYGAQNDHPMCLAAAWRFRNADTVFVSGGGIGMLGYCAGTKQILIDPLALSDPLLSRLPLHHNGNWTVGHVRRDIPEGYPESLAAGENRIQDPLIAALYDDVKQVTQAEALFSKARFAALWRLHNGTHKAAAVRRSDRPVRLITPTRTPLN